MEDLIYMILLLVSFILCFILNVYIEKQKQKKQMVGVMRITCILQCIHCASLFLQIALNGTKIPPIVFEYFAYISGCFLPVTILFIGLIFSKTKLKIKRIHGVLLIIPIISLIVLWTNPLHHLFYIQYSTERNETIYGKYFTIHTIYSYVCIAIGLFYLVSSSVKTSGFFSKQSILILVGIAVPVTVNILFTLEIINLSIYITPISFAVAIICFAIAIFKFRFLSVSPIALQRIVNRISDGYVVINDEGNIIEFNETFITAFGIDSSKLRSKHINDLLKLLEVDIMKFKKAIKTVRSSTETVYIEEHIKKLDKYFNIEINSINNKGTYLATLVLFKDVTQHIKDMKEIKANQEQLMEKERLASLRTNDWRYCS